MIKLFAQNLWISLAIKGFEQKTYYSGAEKADLSRKINGNLLRSEVFDLTGKLEVDYKICQKIKNPT